MLPYLDYIPLVAHQYFYSPSDEGGHRYYPILYRL